MATDTIPGRALAQATIQGSATAYAFRGPDGAWVKRTWSEFADEIRAAGRALIGLGLGHGEKVTVLVGNRPEWTILAQGAMAIGCVPAGIYATCSPAEVAYIVTHSESPVVLVDSAAQLAKLQERRAELGHVRRVVLAKGVRSDDPWTMTWEDFLASAKDTPVAAFEARHAALHADDVAVLIYTSGTTGPPKAVMLTHLNVAHTAALGREMVHGDEHDRHISYLPLSHIAEQIFTVHGAATVGYAVYYAESMDTLLRDLQDVRPTFVFGVPRVWEKMYARLTAALAEATGVKAKLVAWARDVSSAAWTTRFRGGSSGPWLAFQERIARKVVLGKILDRLGLDQARLGVSGAAPIGKEVLEFFASIGLPIHEVYGQSEGTGPTTYNYPHRTKLGSVGIPITGTEVKLGPDGEILLRGHNVFAGYYKDQAATDECLVDGWLHSGDLGAFDADGFLTITGRKKDILITSGGKNIAPKNIEAALKNLPLVSQAVVIGDRRKYLTALLTLDPEATQAFTASRGLPSDAAHALPEVRAELQRGIDEQVNPEFARVESIRRFAVLPRDFSQEAGELTPTMKIKRNVVNALHAEVIESLYADDGG